MRLDRSSAARASIPLLVLLAACGPDETSGGDGGVAVATSALTCGSGTFTSSATHSPASPAEGQSFSVTGSVTNTGQDYCGGRIQLCLKREPAGSTCTYAHDCGVTSLPGGGASTRCTGTFTGVSAGTYEVQLGVFSSDWSQNPHWAWGLDRVAVSSACGSGSFSGTAAHSPASPAAGQGVTVTGTITNTGASYCDGLVQVCVRSASGGDCIQPHTCPAQTIAGGGAQTSCTGTFAGLPAGDYVVQLGVFSADWSQNPYWSWNLDAFTVPAACGSGAYASTATHAPAAPTSGESVTITGTVTNTGQSFCDGLVQLCVRSLTRGGDCVQTYTCPAQTIMGGGARTSCTGTFSGLAADDYTVQLGIFSADWSQNPYWAGEQDAFTVSSAPPPACGTGSYASTATHSPASPSEGAAFTVTGTVTNTGQSYCDGRIQLCLRSLSRGGGCAYVHTCDVGTIAGGGAQTACTGTFTGVAADTYGVELGIFSADWAQNPYWASSGDSISVGAAQPPPAGGPTSRVAGSRLYDACGEELILRGVNKMNVWTDPGGDSFPHIARTGANTVRIVWTTYGAVSTLDALIGRALAEGMVPMVELHDASGDLGLLPAVVDYWVRSDVVAVVRKHERALLVNIANEAGDAVDPAAFVNAYRTAISRMRTAGIRTPLVIDAPGWGQDIETLAAAASQLQAHDPDHNVVFSVHIYWAPGRDVGAALRGFLDGTGQPLVIGEFSNSTVGCGGVVDFRTVMAEAQRLGLGWYAWSWGPGNSNCADMDMTTFPAPGLFDNLRAWGREVALTDPNSIQNTSRRSLAVRSTTCTP